MFRKAYSLIALVIKFNNYGPNKATVILIERVLWAMNLETLWYHAASARWFCLWTVGFH